MSTNTELTLTSTLLTQLSKDNLDILVNGSTPTINSVITTNDEVKLIPRSGYIFDISDGVAVTYYDHSYKTGSVDFDNVTKDVATTSFPPPNMFVVQWRGFRYTVVKAPTPYSTKVTQSQLDYISANEAVLEIDGVAAVLGDTLTEGTKLTLIVNDGWMFTEGSDIKLYYFNNIGSKVVLEFDKIDEQTAVLTFPELSDADEFTSFHFEFHTEQVTSTVGSNQVYLVTNEELQEINSNRYVTNLLTETTYDYGQFILSVLRLPLKIDESLILEPENVYLGDHDTGVSVPKLSSDLILVDMGVIEVPIEEGNLLDYANTTAILHLPRSPSMNIDINYVIGHKVSVQYLIDAYTGIATINVYSSALNSPIATSSVDVGVNVPYTQADARSTVDNSNVVVGGDNGIYYPSIEIVRFPPSNADGTFSIPITDEGDLMNESGYIEVENAKLSVQATKRELEMIESLLMQGVFIND